MPNMNKRCAQSVGRKETVHRVEGGRVGATCRAERDCNLMTLCFAQYGSLMALLFESVQKVSATQAG